MPLCTRGSHRQYALDCYGHGVRQSLHIFHRYAGQRTPRVSFTRARQDCARFHLPCVPPFDVWISCLTATRVRSASFGFEVTLNIDESSHATGCVRPDTLPPATHLRSYSYSSIDIAPASSAQLSSQTTKSSRSDHLYPQHPESDGVLPGAGRGCLGHHCGSSYSD